MSAQFLQSLAQLLYLVSAALFIIGLKGMTKVKSARRGAALAALGMLLAIVGTLVEAGRIDYRWIIAGVVVGSTIGWIGAMRVPMTMMPEMVAIFNGFGGGASVLVSVSTLYLVYIEPGRTDRLADVIGGSSALTMALSILIGGVTFSGSVIAYLKLQGKVVKSEPMILPARHLINAVLFIIPVAIGIWFAFGTLAPLTYALLAWLVVSLALVLGVMLVIPIGGADMPVVISLLNSYSGLAAAATGFVINNPMLIVAGALVGASGLILTKVMTEAMNRSLVNVVFGGFGAVAEGAAGGGEYGPVKSGGPEEAAILLDAAETVIVVPGYGLAVAQAQHTVAEIADLLEGRGARVLYAVHPVAGRMPGHMNVLLAEADIEYEKLLELEESNRELKSADVALIIGANDVVNPAAEKNPASPIAGMPVIQAWNARSVIVIKRSLGAGFAGIKNELFEYPNTMMLFLDAKKALQGIVGELKQLS
ncbi:MAG TPA: NAD(P)(+) transhydrogenase (Re/Si-specific) subunit beta [Thermoanaerobaculia bacterium]|nr:NAD(P)(+) transhydrogenase (Re/Si-specific) subunit beta [Thermoanaerobaculia bacterium]